MGMALILTSLAVGVWNFQAPTTSAVDVTVNLLVPAPVCGNSVKEGDFEDCDDGNTVNGDGCDSACFFEVCGNGVNQINEQCDDANVVDGDGCDSSCNVEVCGNGFLQSGEECDDGNLIDGDDCSALCEIEGCGNGNLNVSYGEECDDGNLINGDGCDSQCFNEVCANGRVQSGEACDDGNVTNGDGCTSLCAVETGFICSNSPSCCSVCGDSVTQCAEQCDDGLQCVNGASCSTNADCFGIGDGTCTARSGDGCSASCTTESTGGGGGGQPVQEITITQITGYPEKRTGADGTNYDSKYFFKVLNANNTSHEVYYSHPVLLNANNSGVSYPYVTISGLAAGTYDLSMKTTSHLTSYLDNAYLNYGENTLNFTNAANLPSIGTLRLLAGDIDNSGTSPSNLGDDVINSVDISELLSRWGLADPGGNSVRSNLNQDSVVDQLDLDILINNLDKEAGL